MQIQSVVFAFSRQIKQKVCENISFVQVKRFCKTSSSRVFFIPNPPCVRPCPYIPICQNQFGKVYVRPTILFRRLYYA